MRRMGLLRVVAAGLVVAASVAVVISPVSGQGTGDDSAVRIVARKLENGKIEFGLRPQLADGSAGELLLSARRLFPTTATVGRWLVSSPQPLDVDGTEETLRIAARRHADGRVEFGLQHQQPDNSWGSTMLPTQRFFPADARVGRWLQSSSLTITTTTPTAPAADQTVGQLVRPVDPAIAAEYHRLGDMYSECAMNYSTGTCNNPDFDVNDFIQAVSLFYNCDWNHLEKRCSGVTAREQWFIFYQVMCDGWYFNRYTWQCYSWEHPNYARG